MSLQIAVGAGNSLNFGANFIQPRFSSTLKDLQDKIAYVCGRTKKGTDSRLFFALNGFLEKWEICP